MPADKAKSPSQDLRNQFADAIENNDLASAKQLLTTTPALANTDLRLEEQRDVFTNGLPLFRACSLGNEELADLLLAYGADPNSANSNPDDRPEFGMPLHVAVCAQKFDLANRLLDSGASPNGHPNCDKATLERAFYLAREAGLNDSLVRRAYAKYLPDKDQLELHTASSMVEPNAKPATKLFARFVDLGGQPPFSAIVREGFDALLNEIVATSRDAAGTPHDHPNSTVFNNIFGASRWYGYPKLHKWFMTTYPDDISTETALCTIGVAVSSHNRDGSYADYREIIVAQLEWLKAGGNLEDARKNPDFKPLHEIATNFTWHDNYGYRAEIAKPECYVDLAELFIAWGFNDINYRHPTTNHSPLSAAVKRGHHPGIATYIEWLLDKGADLREPAPAEVNPISLAKEKGHTEILTLLQAKRSD